MGELMEIVKMIAGSNGGAFAIMIGVLFLAFWVYGKFVRLCTKHDSFENTCATLNARVERLEGDMHEVKGDIQYIKSTLNTIVNIVQGHSASPMKAQSPLALTEIGEKMAADMGADAILSRNFNAIKAKIDADVPVKTPYDVQTYCLEKLPIFPENYLDQDSITSVKSYAYNNGKTLFECLKIIGLKARDEYFKVTGMA